jgi:D-glycero-D-manno-heptose 1,7-bisphosphate phosphatase
MAVSGPSAVFLDKDGTLIDDIPYNVDPTAIQLAPGAEELALLCDRGYRLIIVSNQPGVALGYFPEAALTLVADRLRELLSAQGAWLTEFAYCPHHPAGSVAPYARACDCRKPAPGLIQSAAQSHGIDLGSSWLVGDILDDIEAGRRAGCRSILIDNGNETEWILSSDREPDYTVSDLAEAVRIILAPLRVIPCASLGCVVG